MGKRLILAGESGERSHDGCGADHVSPLSLEWLMRVCWAMCATADRGTSPYEKWLGEFPEEGIDLAEPVAGVIYSAMTAELFRSGKAGLATRIRRRVSRWLGRLSRRVGA